MLCADYEIENVIEKYGKNINELIYPKNSHMDFNIACALFLAAKSEDTLQVDDKKWFNSDEFLLYKS